MDTIAKLDLLSEDSQYDLACACGTGKDDRRRRGLDGKWPYPVPGSGIMLKTLLIIPVRMTVSIALYVVKPTCAAVLSIPKKPLKFLWNICAESG